MSERKLHIEDWANRRGENFRLAHWPSPEPTSTMLLVHHGLGEHAGRYHRLAQGLSELPVDIWSYDLRGHGSSHGPRGHAAGLGGLVDDLEVLIPVLLEKSGAERFVLMGHSLGGATVVHYLTNRRPHDKLAAVILSAAPNRVEKTLPMKLKLAVGSLIVRVAPTMAMASGLDPKGISSLPEEVEKYLDDSLIHDRISAELGLSLTSDPEVDLTKAAKIEHPLLIVHGEADPIVSVDDSRALYAAVSSEDKTLKVFPGLRHEILSESPEDRALLCRMIDEWIRERVEL